MAIYVPTEFFEQINKMLFLPQYEISPTNCQKIPMKTIHTKLDQNFNKNIFLKKASNSMLNWVIQVKLI